MLFLSQWVVSLLTADGHVDKYSKCKTHGWPRKFVAEWPPPHLDPHTDSSGSPPDHMTLDPPLWCTHWLTRPLYHHHQSSLPYLCEIDSAVLSFRCLLIQEYFLMRNRCPCWTLIVTGTANQQAAAIMLQVAEKPIK